MPKKSNNKNNGRKKKNVSDFQEKEYQKQVKIAKSQMIEMINEMPNEIFQVFSIGIMNVLNEIEDAMENDELLELENAYYYELEEFGDSFDFDEGWEGEAEELYKMYDDDDIIDLTKLNSGDDEI